jgi:hypothetical protein
MGKVKERFGERSLLKVNPLAIGAIDPNQLWVHYDDEADSMVIYITGRPMRAVSVHMGDDTYLKVNPASGDIVGFHIEAWEHSFLPAHPELQSVWNKLQLNAAPEPDWSYLLRMLALWIIFIFKSDLPSIPTPQPA